MNKLEKTIENGIAGPSAADLKSLRSGTGIIRFAGALCFPKFA
jgi:hypothetical protein